MSAEESLARAGWPGYRGWGQADYREVHPVPGRLYRQAPHPRTGMYVTLPRATMDFPREGARLTLESVADPSVHLTGQARK